MARIDSVKTIVAEDFEDKYREVIKRLASVINPFMEQTVKALSKRITFSDNLTSQIYELDLAAGVSTVTVAWPYSDKPTAVFIGNVTKSTGAAPSSAFSLSSYNRDKKIDLTFIGLDAATAHKVKVIAQI